MTTQAFARVTSLDPAITVAGVAHSIGLQFVPMSNRSPLTDSKVTGSTSSATDLGSGVWKIVCARGYQQSSYTRVVGAGDSSEIEFQCLMGGNVAATHERQRVISFNNDMSYRGADKGQRAEPGDVFCIDLGGGIEKRYLITAATAYSEAPASVAWQGTDPTALVWYVDHLPNNVFLARESAAETVVFDPSLAAPFDGCEITWENTITPDSGSVAERIFDSTPDYYPVDASFHATDPEYHFDSLAGAFHFGTGGMVTVGADTVHVTHWRHNATHAFTITPASSSQSFVLSPSTSGAGYSGTSDAILLLHEAVYGDFTGPSVVVEYGAGSIEFRAATQSDAIVLGLTWSAGGVLGNVYKRTTEGASISSTASSGTTRTFPFYVRAIRSGSTITLQTSADGSTWASESTTLTYVPEPGWIGIGATATAGLRFHGLTSAQILDVLSPGSLWWLRTDDFASLKWFQDYTPPVAFATQAITEILDDTTNETMSAFSSTWQRDIYAVSGSGSHPLILYSESSGDRVRITQHAPASVPAGAGRPPRTSNQTNFATMSGVDGVATTTVSENQGQYSDVLMLKVEGGESVPSGGNFTIRSCPFASPNSAPSLYWDVENSSGHDWELLDPANYLARWTEGRILIKKSWVDGLGLSATQRLCFRVSGSLFQQRGSNAENYNYLARALDAMDGAYIPLSLSGAASAVSGTAEGHDIVTATFECDGANAYTATLMIGAKREHFFDISDLMDAQSGSWPFWHAGDDGSIMWRSYVGEDPTPFLSATYDVNHSCGSSSWNSKDVGTTAREVRVFPFQADGGADNHVGAAVGADAYATLIHGGSGFSFQGITFNPASTEFVRNCPSGTVCVHAYMRVKFAGLQHNSWALQQYQIGPVGGATSSQWSSYQWNGVQVARYETAGATVIEDTDDSGTVPQYLTTGSIGFHLMGKRANTERIYCPLTASSAPGGYGLYKDEPAGTWQSFGSGLVVGGTGVADEYVLIDITNAINAMLAARDTVYSEFQLWPSVAGVNPGSTAGDMAGLAASLVPDQSVSMTITHPGGSRTAEINYSASGSDIRWDSIEIDSAMACFRFPSSVTDNWTMPVAQPPVIGPY